MSDMRSEVTGRGTPPLTLAELVREWRSVEYRGDGFFGGCTSREEINLVKAAYEKCADALETALLAALPPPSAPTEALAPDETPHDLSASTLRFQADELQSILGIAETHGVASTVFDAMRSLRQLAARHDGPQEPP